MKEDFQDSKDDLVHYIEALVHHMYLHWWKKGLQSRFVKPISPGCGNRD
jgi:hypothetical protein